MDTVMSKAILVLDEMPDGCKRCPLSIVPFKEYGAECVVKMKTVEPRYDWNRPSWCPLREMKDPPEIVTGDDFGFAEGYTNGWRDCLKGIEGAE